MRKSSTVFLLAFLILAQPENSLEFPASSIVNPQIISIENDPTRNGMVRDVRWRNLAPGGLYAGQALIDIELDLEDHPDPDINDVRGHVKHFIHDYQICADGGYQEAILCMKSL